MDILEILKKSKNSKIYISDLSGFEFYQDAILYDITDDKLWIKCLDDKKFSELGNLAKVDIYSSMGIVTGTVKIIETKENFLCVSFPYNIHLTQRREYIRVPINIDLNLSLLQNQKEINCSVKSKDISGKGVAFYSDFKFENYDNIMIDFTFSEKEFSFTCDKIYSNEVCLDNKLYYLTALSFTNITSDEIAFLVKELLTFHIQASKKEMLLKG